MSRMISTSALVFFLFVFCLRKDKDSLSVVSMLPRILMMSMASRRLCTDCALPTGEVTFRYEWLGFRSGFTSCVAFCSLENTIRTKATEQLPVWVAEEREDSVAYTLLLKLLAAAPEKEGSEESIRASVDLVNSSRVVESDASEEQARELPGVGSIGRHAS